MLKNFLKRSGLSEDPHWTKFVQKWLTISLVLHCIAALFSSGFYHADEHFQILEFVNFKLGRSLTTELPLEFNHLMRPWLLPAFFTGLTRGLVTFGIQNPFDWALIYRFISSALGWMSIAGLSLCCFFWFSNSKLRNTAVIALNLIWYIPGFHARPSSENLGGSFFFMGLCTILLFSPSKPKAKQIPATLSPFVALFAGIQFGIAFEVRYQVATLIFGAIGWLLLIARVRLVELIILGIGFMIPVALGAWADHWGYGQWTFVPWHYLNYNLIQNHVSDADTSPWWDYFRRALTESWPILGFLTLLSFPIAWLKNPRHILTWGLIPFFLLHLLIGHKELRFLFPLAHVGGLLVVLSVESVFLKFEKNWALKGLLLLNLIGLVVLTLTPAWTPIRFYQQLYHFRPQGFTLYFKDDSFQNLGGANLTFYRAPQAKLIRIENYDEFSQILEKSPSEVAWLFYSKSQLPKEADLIRNRCHPEFSTFPSWITRILDRIHFQAYFPKVTNWTVYRCKNLD